MDLFENISKKIFLVLILSLVLIFSAFKVQAEEQVPTYQIKQLQKEMKKNESGD
jgi:hypothetical protein